MAIDDVRSRSKDIRARLQQIETGLDAPTLLEKRDELEARMSGDGFWNDQEAAQAVVGELKRVKSSLSPIEAVRNELDELEVMIELAVEAGGGEGLGEAEVMLESVEAAMERLEFRIMLDGEYDARDAYLSIQAGAGGTDASDWAEILLRMYTRWAEQNGFDVSGVDRLDDEEAGIKSATIMVKGEWAFGYLRAEHGVHRLVRLSPFDAQSRRQTSFASVDVMPVLDDTEAMEIRSEDLRTDTYRASGAGGQHVNKTDSAIRLTHLPTGIVVACQSERSQHKNRATAMKMLAAKLVAKAEAERQAELDGIQGEKGDIGWGHQIRSYVMHPYSMVKDHRTNMEVGNVQAVLDGDVQGFIETFLRSRQRGG